MKIKNTGVVRLLVSTVCPLPAQLVIAAAAGEKLIS